jgi:hypothetical protein
MISKEEFLALAAQKYEQIHQLNQLPTFYDYEKSFVHIWEELGRQVLEKNLSKLPNDRRKKKDEGTLRTHSHS